MSYLLNDEKGGDDKRNEYTWKMEYKCSQKICVDKQIKVIDLFNLENF